MWSSDTATLPNSGGRSLLLDMKDTAQKVKQRCVRKVVSFFFLSGKKKNNNKGRGGENSRRLLFYLDGPYTDEMANFA